METRENTSIDQQKPPSTRTSLYNAFIRDQLAGTGFSVTRKQMFSIGLGNVFLALLLQIAQVSPAWLGYVWFSIGVVQVYLSWE